MNLNKWFQPTYSKLILLFAGVILGMTIAYHNLIVKLCFFICAVLLVIWSDKIRNKELVG